MGNCREDLSLIELVSAGVRSTSGLVLWGSEWVGKGAELSISDDLPAQIVQASCSSPRVTIEFSILL